jgi:hypothetical protein
MNIARLSALSILVVAVAVSPSFARGGGGHGGRGRSTNAPHSNPNQSIRLTRPIQLSKPPRPCLEHEKAC